jgi:molybdopterin molybdotransferase
VSENCNLSVGAAQDCVLGFATTGGSEEIALERALGRVLAEDMRANRDQPPYDVSAMDGFAVRSADLSTGGVRLTVIEDIKAGDKPERTVASGQCARIMTGAPVPLGADAVIRVEDTRRLTDDSVEITVPVKAGNDIRVRGENMHLGDVVLHVGTEITPGVIGLLATVKRARITVYRRPRVAILSSGDELEALEAPFDADKVPESNSHALMAQLQALGIEPVRLGIAHDDPAELAAFLRQGLDYDVLLVSGGSSVGVHDHVRPTLEALGVAMHFWRVEMKPGHPLAFGTRGGTLVFGLPGNPVSSMVCFEQFVLPALRRMMGHPNLFRRTVTATLAHPLKHRPGRMEFIRVTLAMEAGRLLATSTGAQSSGDLCSMARADGLLVVPAESGNLAAGDVVQVQLLDGSLYQHAAGFVEVAA